MLAPKLSDALSIEDSLIRADLETVQSQLEAIPNTFYALFWLYTHDFLYVSQSIEKVLGYPQKKFEHHGLVFFQSLIPQHLIKPIYDSMNAQAEQIGSSPGYICNPSTFQLDAAVLNCQGEEVAVHYQSIILDAKPHDPVSHLMLCSWIDTRHTSPIIAQGLTAEINALLEKVHKLYVKENAERFRLLALKNMITAREKQVASLLTRGHSSKEIAHMLGITFHTVESHRKNLLGKFGAKNTAEFIHMATMALL